MQLIFRRIFFSFCYWSSKILYLHNYNYISNVNSWLSLVEISSVIFNLFFTISSLAIIVIWNGISSFINYTQIYTGYIKKGQTWIRCCNREKVRNLLSSLPLNFLLCTVNKITVINQHIIEHLIIMNSTFKFRAIGNVCYNSKHLLVTFTV